MFAKTCKIYQLFKNRKNPYGHLPPKNISELKPWDSMHVDLIGPYIRSIRQQQPGYAVIHKISSITSIPIINLATGWFEIVDIPTFDLEELVLGNDGYVY